MLPEPALSFTIPSIHDGSTTLECRIYHPHSLTPNPRAPPWRKHAAVVAHPYAPLGGCYDDAVVETVAAVLLRQGFVVGTFNFRGAGKSTGRTSWTSKAERSDYMSFAAFVYYYVHYLDPFKPQGELTDVPVFLLCGYSYGAMITKLLPTLDATLEPFIAPKVASAAADIRLRAQHLAEKQNLILGSARVVLTEGPMSPRKAAFGMRVGGDEDQRRSQEHSRRSFSADTEEKIRKGVADLMQKAKSHQLHHHKKKNAEQKSDGTPAASKDAGAEEHKVADSLPPVNGLITPRVAYLLVSPPVGWATSLMTMNLGGLFGKHTKPSKTKDQQKLIENPTLAVYGDADVFVAVKKFREWTSKLQSAPGSMFRAHEVSTAGHFYIEEGTMQRLADAVREFSGELLGSATQRLDG
ncbi:hypothetical protein M406DRAFT_46087 [Cryphonectria parasitica EP155]|uniref:AB hydrolase-1 domain-containing protein n=1 Tax=Cryphonectria parasitica (strain ATCC 38755 / EP155) TaxID=660469 RepID=A0A9P5CLV6_CRYP1|nr:uncharacterized protein M406DRAFT_46087 [Cryphonectria parasitica EP155]KAF3762215.1 hypothetical protein M406DRAFT_46087 [Cryphonectria parasitica EP155]